MDSCQGKSVSINLKHHEREWECDDRSFYRKGSRLTAVKVYTVNKESEHLLIYNVPVFELTRELAKLCSQYGTFDILRSVSKGNPEIEEFTEVFHIHYTESVYARRAKKCLDNRSFYGNILHICYAPELESVEETKKKLISRRKYVAYHTGNKKPFVKQKRLKIVNRPHDIVSNSNSFHEAVSCDNNIEGKSCAMTQIPNSSQYTTPSGISENSVSKDKTWTSNSSIKFIPRPVNKIIFHKGKTEV